MHRKHEHLWSGNLEKIASFENHINLFPQTCPFKLAPYLAGPKERNSQCFEVKKHLAAVVIETSNSEWDAPVLIAPKKGRKATFLYPLLDA